MIDFFELLDLTEEEVEELLPETNPTEKSASKGMVASPRFGETEDHLEDEIFGSKSERENFIRRFDEANREVDS